MLCRVTNINYSMWTSATDIVKQAFQLTKLLSIMDNLMVDLVPHK